MNFVQKCVLLRSCSAVFIISTTLFFSGCGGNGSQIMPSPEQLAEFQNAGPVLPTKINMVMPGDLLELYMPSVLQAVTADPPLPQNMAESYLCRVSSDGNITVPVVGLVPVAEKTLTEIETAIVNVYYPKYCFDLPTVVVRVNEYRTIPRFTVIGLVNKPGTYEYPPNAPYNLIEALAYAGDLNLAADPQYVTIYRQKADGTIVDAKFKIIDDSRLTSAFSVPVKPGDIIAVEQTSQTRTNLFLNNVFRINAGLYTTANIYD